MRSSNYLLTTYYILVLKGLMQADRVNQQIQEAISDSDNRYIGILGL